MMTPEQQAAADAANAASSQAQAELGPNEPIVEAPAPAEPIAEPAPVTDPAQQAPEAPVSVSEPAAPVEPEPEEDYTLDPIPSFNFPAPQQVQPQAQPVQAPQAPAPVAPQAVPALNIADFTDQFGNVDPAKFTQAIAQRDQLLTQSVVQNVMREVTTNILPQAEARSAQQLMAIRTEERMWKAAETAYPELGTNKELRDLVHNTRLNYVGQGAKQLTPKAAADKLFKYIGQARDEDTSQANERVTYQAAATHTETANNTAPQEQVARTEARRNIASHDKATARDARHSLLKQMMDDGTLKLPS